MPRTLIWSLLLLAVLYAGICLLLFVYQRGLIYFPQPRHLDAPSLTLQQPDATIQVSLRPYEGPNALIYFGGNAEDVSLNLPDFTRAFPDHALYLMHYRGYGGSDGSPSEEALAADALALYDRVATQHSCIAVVGRSLGSGVAIRLASLRPASRLILITPYNSLAELATRQFPVFPVGWLLKDRFESWRYAGAITVLTRLIVAERDDIIPRESSERLLRHFPPGVASLHLIPSRGHNDLSASPAYLPLLQAGVCPPASERVSAPPSAG
ncbi:alpha/beta hydrolase [Stutzerimonas azotifigens]|uniref:Alpha/beta hydrolase n=1 Tax=Stutzerimonas azotifigens TaxID=291995 RepID=A0ABR5YZF9_9GAMM|nr:alpha/beta hydrolase [Stutzerimonas azotifigens]MBA1273338.1 alpha/beta hydrolase [Stutzerimonas azotifigens]